MGRNPNLRALHVVHWLNRGGVEMWLLGLVKEAPRVGFSIDICCKGPHTGSLTGEASRLGSRVLHCRQGMLGPYDRGFRRAFERILTKGNYDVVHSHVGDLSAPIMEAAKAVGIPCRIVTYHSVVPHRLSRYSLLARMIPDAAIEGWQIRERKRMINAATQIVSCSDAVQDTLFDEQPGPKYSCLHPSVDLERFEHGPELRMAVGAELAIDDDSPRIVNVGNIDTPKNQTAVVEVARSFSVTGTPGLFLIIGDGPLRQTLQQTAEEYRLTNVRFLGRRSDVPRLLSASDIAFHPSVVEGLPVSVLEYQAARLPVVASGIAPVLEALAPPLHAWTAQPHDIERFAVLLRRLIDDSSLCDELRVAGRTHVERHFSLHACAMNLARIYGAGTSLH